MRALTRFIFLSALTLASASAQAAQFDCKVALHATNNREFTADFYGESTDKNTIPLEIINQDFDLDNIKLNLRILFDDSKNYMLLQLSQPGNEKIWLSSEGYVHAKEHLDLAFTGTPISPDLDGGSLVRCSRW